MTEDVIAAWTERSRAAQGLPGTITDPGTLARVVTLALAPVPEPLDGARRPAWAGRQGGRGGRSDGGS